MKVQTIEILEPRRLLSATLVVYEYGPVVNGHPTRVPGLVVDIAYAGVTRRALTNSNSGAVFANVPIGSVVNINDGEKIVTLKAARKYAVTVPIPLIAPPPPPAPTLISDVPSPNYFTDASGHRWYAEQLTFGVPAGDADTLVELFRVGQTPALNVFDDGKPTGTTVSFGIDVEAAGQYVVMAIAVDAQGVWSLPSAGILITR